MTLTKEQWLLAENGDNSIGYMEFEYNTRALIHTYGALSFAIFIFYCCYLLTGKITLFVKIILGLMQLTNILSPFLLIIALSTMTGIKNIKNKWLQENRYVLSNMHLVDTISLGCYVYFVYLEKPLPIVLNNILAPIMLIFLCYWIKNLLINYKNTDIPIEWLLKHFPREILIQRGYLSE